MNLTLPQKLGLAVALLGFISGAGTQLTDIFAPLGSIAPVIVKEIVTIAGFISGILGVILAMVTTQNNALKAVVEMAKDPTSPVQGLVTTATPEGKALAASIPGPIYPAGSEKATEVAKP